MLSSISYLFLHSAVFLLLLFSHSFSFRHPLCHDDDHSSLLEFNRSVVFNTFSCANYTKLSSWNVGVDCCLWDGVECNVETGHVIGLDLSSSCLFGSINSSSPLFLLGHLESLDLSYNNFNLSSIPRGIRNLRQLTDLNISYSNFVGQIPSEILELSNLVSLDLSWNQLMLEKPSLKDVVETFPHLNKLHLIDVTISSRVPQSLSNLTSLSSLLLENCSLLGEFPSGVFRLPNLRDLSLRDNPNLTGHLPDFDPMIRSLLEELVLDGTNFTGQLPVSLGNLKSLRVLSVAKCHFGGVIPSSVGNLTYLEFLQLSNNHLSGKIPSSLGRLRNLASLGLGYNNFSRGSLSWVGTLTNLQIFDMCNTNTFGAIPSSLGNLTQLSALGLDNNQITGPLPSWLGNFTQLTILSIRFNELQGPIPEAIFRLPNLQVVYLQDNNLSGTLKYDSFLQMQHLSKLQLSENRLSVISSPFTNVTLPKFTLLGLMRCNIKEFPAFLQGQNQLEWLNLDSNNIEGHVPNWLFSLKSLTYLAFDNNSLTGFEQPHGILSLPNLSIFGLSYNQFTGPLPFPSLSIIMLDASHNRFSGHIPPLFCNLTSALHLDFSNNNLSGPLPSCFANSAMVLKLGNNSLSGAIPDNYFPSGCKLKVLDFSQNKLEGKLPTSLAHCSELEILNLGENRMNGVFPSWLGILPHLRILLLRSNHFQGVIGKPLSEFELNRLQIIDLSDNNFTGKLPVEYFRNWEAMKNVEKDHLAYMQAGIHLEIPGYIWNFNDSYSIRIVNKGTERPYDRILEFFVVVDLSCNRFEGEIPEIVNSLRALQSLNLSNNMLTGLIPSSLENLMMLEALDLSRNDLSGQIPVQLTSVTSLEVFNVSYNNLTGPIPKGKQFGTFDDSSFSGNPGLCGDMLSRKCGKIETPPLPPSESSKDEDESPFQLNWEIVLIGFGTGVVIGVAFGWALDTRKYEWLVKKKFARRVRRRRRN